MNRRTKVPKYRLHKATGKAIVVLGGRMFYLGQYGSIESRAEYARLIAEWTSQGGVTPSQRVASLGACDPGLDMTITELILAYWRHVQETYIKDGQLTTEVGVIHQVLKVVRELYGHTQAKAFGPLALGACQDAMIARGWSRKSINRQVIRIRALFKWAASRELLPVSIYEALRTVEGLRKGRSTAKERPRVRPIPDAVVDATIPHLSATVAAMVRVQRLSGMRPQEVVGLRAIDIDMGDLTCWTYRPARHKTEHDDKERIVYIGPRAIEVIRPFLGLDLTAYLFSPRRSEAERHAGRRAGRKTPLYRSHVAHQAAKNRARGGRALGEHYTVGTYRQAIHRACDKAFPHPAVAKLPAKDLDAAQRAEHEAWCADHHAELESWRKARRWNPHALRHSAATQIRGRFGIEAAQAVLGHSELDTTELYAEKNLNTAREVMRQIG
jgi:integrase